MRRAGISVIGQDEVDASGEAEISPCRQDLDPVVSSPEPHPVDASGEICRGRLGARVVQDVNGPEALSDEGHEAFFRLLRPEIIKNDGADAHKSAQQSFKIVCEDGATTIYFMI